MSPFGRVSVELQPRSLTEARLFVIKDFAERPNKMEQHPRNSSSDGLFSGMSFQSYIFGVHLGHIIKINLYSTLELTLLTILGFVLNENFQLQNLPFF